MPAEYTVIGSSASHLVREVRVIIRFVSNSKRLSDKNRRDIEDMVRGYAEAVIEDLVPDLPEDVKVETASRLDDW